MMDLHSTVQFKKDIDGRLYTFTMPSTAPVGEAYDVLFDCLNSILAIANKSLDKMNKKSSEIDSENNPI